MDIREVGWTEPHPHPVHGFNNCFAVIDGAGARALDYIGSLEEYSDTDVNLEPIKTALLQILLNVKEARKLIHKLKRETLEGKVYKVSVRAVVDLPIELDGEDLEALL